MSIVTNLKPFSRLPRRSDVIRRMVPALDRIPQTRRTSGNSRPHEPEICTSSASLDTANLKKYFCKDRGRIHYTSGVCC